MAIVRYEPLNLFDQFNREINRMFSGGPVQANTAQERNWVPAVDIREEENRYLLSADIPGVDRGNIEVTLEDGVLTLKGERSREAEASDRQYRRKERVHGAFMRQFTLPETADTQNISATIKDGVLDVVIPKYAKPQPTRVTIN